MFGANPRILAQRYPPISELSRRLRINRTQLNRYLSGESFPRPDVLDRNCEFFDVDALILLEPVASLNLDADVMTSPVPTDFFGFDPRNIPEDIFPSGVYRILSPQLCQRKHLRGGARLYFPPGQKHLCPRLWGPRGHETARLARGQPNCGSFEAMSPSKKMALRWSSRAATR